MKKIWKIYGDDPLMNLSIENPSIENAAMFYDNPDTILNEYANKVYEDTDQQFNGIVTEYTGGNSNETTFALYIVAPKLKDYMYRLIEVNVPNIIQPYPLEITLFAKEPKNHRTFNCANAIEFRKKLIELIESPVTRLILKHLKTLIDINVQNSINNFSFTLTDKEATKKFFLKAGTLPITIKKIILTSHLGKKPDEWGGVIANSCVKIISKNLGCGNKLEKTISLLQFINLYQVQPVLELKLFLPDYEFYSQNNSSDSELEFTLMFENKNIQFDFFYDAHSELVKDSKI
ncbi:MAG: hypothetical protein RJA76_487 [Bacteroidota bacterium]|jgi:hypothetical protein